MTTQRRPWTHHDIIYELSAIGEHFDKRHAELDKEKREAIAALQVECAKLGHVPKNGIVWWLRSSDFGKPCIGDSHQQVRCAVCDVLLTEYVREKGVPA